MRFSSSCLKSLLLLAATAAVSVEGVLYGDEIYGDVPGGRFWAFYPGGIAIIDPESCTIENKITQDREGLDLPSSWNDGVYMQYNNGESLEGYVMISSRVDRVNALGESVTDAYAISTTSNEVEAKIEVGSRAVHSYGVYTHDEFWVHSDGDGHFYVISLEELSQSQATVEAHQETAHHGKLLWDEDGTIGNRGFATSTGEQFLFEIDIMTKEKTRAFDFSSFVNPGTCSGLHAISYSAQNQHIYSECTGGPGSGILEFDVSGNDIAFVHQHTQATGALYEVPDGSFVVASNKGNNMLHIFKPNGSGQQSSIEIDIPIEGHPSTVSFYPNGERDGEANFIACMPLTENLNQNHRDSTGAIACDYSDCSGAESVQDVSQGICAHDGLELMQVSSVTSDAFCQRCADSANFMDGNCTCTPNCGSCDPTPNYDDSESGVVCIDLAGAIAGDVTEGTLVPNAGGVHQGRPYGGSPQCTFGRTYRTHKRGRNLDASVANIPYDSIQIVNMETMEKKCDVPLPGPPGRVLYAPSTPVNLENTGSSSGNIESSSGKARFGFASFITVSVLALVNAIIMA